MPTDPSSLTLNAAIKYNPHLWGPDELRAIFVVRQDDLKQIMEQVAASPWTQTPQHLLITGHRGMGKSTLLQRLALAINETPEVAAQWLPLTFPEEQYTVSALSEFWLNVLDALADALERAGAHPADLATLDAEIQRLAELPKDQAETQAQACLDRWITEHQRGLVLLVDSSDLLLDSLIQGEAKPAKGKKGSDATALWRLRRALSHQKGLYWIGASYQALEANHQYQDAFHDFFALHELRPLTVAEMRAALLALARQFGMGGRQGLTGEAAQTEMERLLDRRPERLAALRLLSGGNPRATTTLYELFSAGGDENLQNDLKRLLDVMTPLYKARMEALSEQPRKLFAHLMEHWHPLGAKELAQESGIPNTTVSGQLTRLEVEGLIHKVSLRGKGKRNGYQASERLFNVWYLMRYGARRVRQRMAWAVEFMRLWYSREELGNLARMRAQCHGRDELGDADSLAFSRAVASALGDEDAQAQALDWSVFSAAHRQARRTREAVRAALPSSLFELDGEDAGFRNADDYLTRFAALEQRLAECPYAKDELDSWVDAIKGSLSLPLEDKERIAEAMATTGTQEQYEGVRRVIAEETKLLGDPDFATVFEAVCAGRFFPECIDGRLAYVQMQACFIDQPGSYGIALDLLADKNQGEWLEKACRQAVALDEKDARNWFNLGYVLHIHGKRYEEAEAAYREAIDLDDKDAGFWNALGSLLEERLKRYEEAEAAYRWAIALDERDVEYRLKLGNLLTQLRRHEEAEAVYRQAIALEGKNAKLWNNLGNLLARLRRYEEAEAAYRQAIALDETESLPWNNLGTLLQEHLKRYDEAEAAYRQAIALDEKDVRPWNNLGRLLQDHLRRYEEAKSSYRQAIALDEENAYSWVCLARLQAFQSQMTEATTSYRAVLQELPEGHAQPLRLQAHLWLGNLDLAQQALDLLAKLASEGHVSAFSKLREQCWQCAQIHRAPTLAELMEQSPYADFLLPFSLALRAWVASEIPVGAAPEILALANEILGEIRDHQPI